MSKLILKKHYWREEIETFELSLSKAVWSAIQSDYDGFDNITYYDFQMWADLTAKGEPHPWNGSELEEDLMSILEEIAEDGYPIDVEYIRADEEIILKSIEI